MKLGGKTENDGLSGCTVANQWRIERVVSAMQESVGELWSLDRFVEISGISRFYLIRVFCQVTGLSPFQFLSALRLQEATRLLMTTDVSVTEACFCVGYNSQSTFTRKFTDRFGLPPLGLRRMTPDLGQLPLERLAELMATREGGADEGSAIAGEVVLPHDFDGMVMVGLFNGHFSQSRQVACTLLSSSRMFRLPLMPDGPYSLFGIALPRQTTLRDLLLAQPLLYGRTVGTPLVVRDRQPTGAVDIVLRPAKRMDPPLVIGPPVLILQQLMAAAAPRRVAGLA